MPSNRFLRLLPVTFVVALVACGSANTGDGAESTSDDLSLESLGIVFRYLRKFFIDDGLVQTVEDVKGIYKKPERRAFIDLAHLDEGTELLDISRLRGFEAVDRAMKTNIGKGLESLRVFEPKEGFTVGHSLADDIDDPIVLQHIMKDAWKGKSIIKFAQDEEISSVSQIFYVPAKGAKPLSAVIEVDGKGGATINLTKALEGTPFGKGGKFEGKFLTNNDCCELIYSMSRSGDYEEGMPWFVPSFKKKFIKNNPEFIADIYPNANRDTIYDILEEMYEGNALYNHPNVFAASQHELVSADKVAVNAAGRIVTTNPVVKDGEQFVELKAVDMCSGHTDPDIKKNYRWVKAAFALFEIILGVTDCPE